MPFKTRPPAAPEVRSGFLRDLVSRGAVSQCTDFKGLDDRFATGRVVAYAGFDLTADSLHVGHLVPLLTLRRLQRAGHKPLVLLGTATTRIGDPSFRDSSRPLLDAETIAANRASIGKLLGRFLTFGEGPTDAVLLDNADWLDGERLTDFLGLYGPLFSVSRMTSFESVRSRLEDGRSLTLLEFMYMVLQAYDFLHLARSWECALQIGASDQWANILCGVDLTRKADGRSVFGLTLPLLTTADGRKMGKSAVGAVWLDPARLDPAAFWQFWRTTADADVGRFLYLFSDMPVAEVEALVSGAGAALNLAKVRLADEVTALVHGPAAATDAREKAERDSAEGAKGGLRAVALSPSEAARIGNVAALAVRAGLVRSLGEARRLAAQGGLYADGRPVEDPDTPVAPSCLDGEGLRISAGKKRHARLTLDLAGET